ASGWAAFRSASRAARRRSRASWRSSSSAKDESAMRGGGLGGRTKRNEKPRLLTRRALFIDAVALPGMLHVAFLRRPPARPRLGTIDARVARASEGVVDVVTADDLGAYWKPGPLLVPPPPVEGMEFHERTQVPLARGKVRHVGEPIAAVVATS